MEFIKSTLEIAFKENPNLQETDIPILFAKAIQSLSDGEKAKFFFEILSDYKPILELIQGAEAIDLVAQNLSYIIDSLKKDPSNSFLRQSFVQNSISCLESFSNFDSKVIFVLIDLDHRLAEIEGMPRLSDVGFIANALRPEELIALQQISVEVNDQGKIKMNPKFVPIKGFLRLTQSSIKKVCPFISDINFRDNNWNHIIQSIDLRHCLTHPKDSDDLIVSDEMGKNIVNSIPWYTNQKTSNNYLIIAKINELMNVLCQSKLGAIFKAAQEHADIDAVLKNKKKK